MFILAIFYLTTSNLPWFMDLTFQVLLWLSLFILSGAISLLCSSSVSTIYQSGSLHLSVSYLFVFSYCSWGFQGKNTEVLCHSLLQWTTFCQNVPPWLICLGWPYPAWLIVSLSYRRLWSMWSFWLVFVIVVFILSALWWMRIKGLCKLPDGRDWLWGKLSLALKGRAMLNKSWIQFSAYGWGCAPSL